MARKGCIWGLCAVLSLWSAIAAQPARGQITPANDGTGTTVTPNGSNSNQFDITGGSFSDGNTNLFHSFREFGLRDNEIANFMSQQGVQNILGRIIGGDPSLINGLIRVTGSDANLFLMNPAGFVFGSNATLNVSGSFTATTATAIGFGGDRWFEAFGDNKYMSLTGNPSIFAFDGSRAGSIINAGDLEVKEGNALNLIGSSVINTGQVSAPGGNIRFVGVQGTNKVKISLPGSAISIVVNPPRDRNGNRGGIRPVDLPRLLTIGNQGGLDTGLDVDDDIEVKLRGSGGSFLFSEVGVASGPLLRLGGTTLTIGSIQDVRIFGEIINRGGDINLASLEESVIAGNLITSSLLGGGELTIEAKNGIAVGQIDTNATVSRGGDVFLRAQGDIQVAWINAQGGLVDGRVEIVTERFFRATDTFESKGVLASISGGEVFIQHGGGKFEAPFQIAKVGIIELKNGTAGAIVAGEGDENKIEDRAFTNSLLQGNIELRTQTSRITQSSEEEATASLSDREEWNLDDTEQLISDLEEYFTRQTESFVAGIGQSPIVDLESVGNILKQVELEVDGIRPATMYVVFPPRSTLIRANLATARTWKKYPLQLILVTGDGDVIRKFVPKATREDVKSQVDELRKELLKVENEESYKQHARQLYEWLIEPMEEEFVSRGIDHLVFVMDEDLLNLPIAALYDGKEHIVEKGYSIGFTPSMSLLTDTTYAELKNAKLLVMGASEFEDESDLPGTEIEMKFISKFWPEGNEGSTSSLQNEDFTPENWLFAQQQIGFPIAHIATHADFVGSPDKSAGNTDYQNSYIAFGDRKLTFKELASLNLSEPLIELLVLSACQTAIGNREAELGLAGLARQIGVKSVLASLWQIPDTGNIGLISRFYYHLKTAPTKAEALRRAQQDMLSGQVEIKDGSLQSPGLPAIELSDNSNNKEDNASQKDEIPDEVLDHPRYWSSFVLIGTPW